MSAVDIQELDNDNAVGDKVRLRAARNGRSVDAEMRAILTDAVAEDPSPGWAHVLWARFQELGGVELDIPRSGRVPIPELPE